MTCPAGAAGFHMACIPGIYTATFLNDIQKPTGKLNSASISIKKWGIESAAMLYILTVYKNNKQYFFKAKSKQWTSRTSQATKYSTDVEAATASSTIKSKHFIIIKKLES